VVKDFAALLRSYNVNTVTGDRYGGEWPRARFREHGIEYVPSARPKSDIYIDLLPLLNAQRVELLDIPHLAAQLVGLERRTARSGKDSVDHTPGGHDDVANAAAGVLVGLDLDRRPALVKPSELLDGGEPVPVPKFCDFVFATLTNDQKGNCATLYVAASRHHGIPVTLLDFDAQPMGAAMFGGIAARLRELVTQCRPRLGCLGVFTNDTLGRHALSRGLHAELIPPEYAADPARLALSGAGHVSAGKVRIATPAHERAKTSPLGGALNIRGGDATADDPLRFALLASIAIALDDASISVS
jgi:hypothetical protein